MTHLAALSAALDKPLIPDFAHAVLVDLRAALAHHYDAKDVQAVAAQIMRQAVTDAHLTAFRSQIYRTYRAIDQATRDNSALQVWDDDNALNAAQKSAMALMTETTLHILTALAVALVIGTGCGAMIERTAAELAAMQLDMEAGE